MSMLDMSSCCRPAQTQGDCQHISMNWVSQTQHEKGVVEVHSICCERNVQHSRDAHARLMSHVLVVVYMITNTWVAICCNPKSNK